MNWDAIIALAESAGAVAVIVTLAYLAVQVRYLKRQSILASFQHTEDAINDCDASISQSEELASIIVRGQVSRRDLSSTERLRFDHVFGRLMNIAESWHFQVMETAGVGTYREQQLRNICEFIKTRFDYPGVLEFWEQYQQLYNADMHKLIKENTTSRRWRTAK